MGSILGKIDRIGTAPFALLGKPGRKIREKSAKIFDRLAPDPGDEPTIPEPPTIDEASKRRDQLDRIRRRRGVLSTIFGGASASTSSPTVGVKTLLGG